MQVFTYSEARQKLSSATHWGQALDPNLMHTIEGKPMGANLDLDCMPTSTG
ncbi:MAG: hypothetical protein STSR0007_14780 [Thermovirga sp.]